MTVVMAWGALHYKHDGVASRKYSTDTIKVPEYCLTGMAQMEFYL